MDKKKTIITIAAIVLGLLVALFAWVNINNPQDAEASVNILVPAKDISPYSKLQADDFKTRTVKEGEVDSYTVLESAKLQDMITTVTLYANKPVDKRSLSLASDTSNKQIIGVLIDSTRLSNATAGDYVDVYWVGDKTETTAVAPAIILSRKAQIIGVDGEGGSTSGLSGQKISAESKAKAVYLLVNPEEAPYIIQGSMKNSIALSKVLNPQSVPDVLTTEEEEADVQ